MREGLSGKVVDALTWILVLGILAFGAFTVYPKFQRRSALMRENAELQDQIDRKKAEIAQLEENQRRFKTDADFVEAIARQNHRVFPGEYVFILEKK